MCKTIHIGLVTLQEVNMKRLLVLTVVFGVIFLSFIACDSGKVNSFNK